VPPYFAARLSYPERVTPWNVDKLREAVIAGPGRNPGAVAVEDERGRVVLLRKDKKVGEMLCCAVLCPALPPSRVLLLRVPFIAGCMWRGAASTLPAAAPDLPCPACSCPCLCRAVRTPLSSCCRARGAAPAARRTSRGLAARRAARSTAEARCEITQPRAPCHASCAAAGMHCLLCRHVHCSHLLIRPHLYHNRTATVLPLQIVYRTMEDGDFMLTNRQPTLHKPGMMGHRARVMRCEERAAGGAGAAGQGRAGQDARGAQQGHLSLLDTTTTLTLLTVP
jgi:DNA-directed RNA polymerase beta' subunit